MIHKTFIQIDVFLSVYPEPDGAGEKYRPVQTAGAVGIHGTIAIDDPAQPADEPAFRNPPAPSRIWPDRPTCGPAGARGDGRPGPRKTANPPNAPRAPAAAPRIPATRPGPRPSL